MKRLILIIAICTGVLQSNPLQEWGSPVGADDAFERAAAAHQRGDYAEALDGYRVLAEKGHIDAQLNLGFMYDNSQGVPHYIAAAKWYRKAAEQGMPIAQTRLGDMYRDGRGVPQDDAEAVKWFRRSAEQGQADAQNNLGSMYGIGQGVSQDYVRAHMWYSLAAAQGHDMARMNRDITAKKMTPAQIAEAQKLALE